MAARKAETIQAPHDMSKKDLPAGVMPWGRFGVNAALVAAGSNDAQRAGRTEPVGASGEMADGTLEADAIPRLPPIPRLA
jgi:hypothetical protein